MQESDRDMTVTIPRTIAKNPRRTEAPLISHLNHQTIPSG